MGKPYNCYTNDDIENIDVSYYPEQYLLSDLENSLSHICNHYPDSESLATVSIDNYYAYSMTISIPSWTIPLAKIPAYTSRPEKNYSQTKLTPKEDPTGTYKFRLYGHDITITPELLSGNIISEPELTEQEKYIEQLEEENKLLKQELESYKNCDSDNDGMFTANDAQMILNYYGEYLSGNVSGKVTDYGNFVSNYDCSNFKDPVQ